MTVEQNYISKEHLGQTAIFRIATDVAPSFPSLYKYLAIFHLTVSAWLWDNHMLHWPDILCKGAKNVSFCSKYFFFCQKRAWQPIWFTLWRIKSTLKKSQQLVTITLCAINYTECWITKSNSLVLTLWSWGLGLWISLFYITSKCPNSSHVDFEMKL